MNDEKLIYIDVSQPAILGYSGRLIYCRTVDEVNQEFVKLPPELRKTATIETDGRQYGADEIGRFRRMPRSDNGLKSK